MKRRWLIPSAAVFLIAAALVAASAPFPNIQQDVGVCDPNSPLHCVAPDVNGAVPITGSISATTAATATAVAPTYVEGTSNPLSMDLAGGIRITGTINATSAAQATTAAPSYTNNTSNAFSQNLTGDLRTISKQSGTWTEGIDQSTAGTTNAVSLKYLNTTAVSTGNGAMDAGTQRTALASDSPGIIATGTAGSASSTVLTVQGIASMTPLLVTPAANSAVNVAQFNGVTPLMGNGTSGTGAQRVAIASDNTAVTGLGAVATGAAPPANAIYQGVNGQGATGGLVHGLIGCDLHAKYDASDNGNITLVTGVASRKVYICGYLLANGGTATNLSLTEGSDANCATNNAALTPAYQILANQSVGVMSPFWGGLVNSTNAYYVCIKSSAGNAHQGELWYTIL